jgi:acetylglutamate kinase
VFPVQACEGSQCNTSLLARVVVISDAGCVALSNKACEAIIARFTDYIALYHQHGVQLVIVFDGKERCPNKQEEARTRNRYALELSCGVCL